MMKLLTVKEMLAVERASDAAGHTYDSMMEHAGRSLAEIVHARYGSRHSKALALVGKGNNGGDALVALAYLQQWGWQTAFLLVGRDGDPLVARARAAGSSAHQWQDIPGNELPALLREFPILLDGVLGTGIRLPLRPPVDEFLPLLRKGLPKRMVVIAVDTPSGVDCRTGEAAPDTLPADLTVTMAAAKTGHYAYPAAGLVGELVCGDIGLPDDLPEWTGIRRQVMDGSGVSALMPERPPDAHKGTFGTAVVCAGSRHFIGAALLAGKAAFRSGAGLITTACPAPMVHMLAGHFPESTWLPLPEKAGSLNEAAADELLGSLGGADALLIGPGFGMTEQTQEFIVRMFSSSEKLPPMVIDADGLKLAARIPDWPDRLPADTVLTPHPGEMAALCGRSVQEIQAARLDSAEHFARVWGHVVVLKGAFTLVASPNGRTALVPISSPALARAGTGDVLAGLITGLRAQGMGAYEAAVAGAWLHGRAGLIALRKLGHPAAVLAGDVLDAVPDALVETSGFEDRHG